MECGANSESGEKIKERETNPLSHPLAVFFFLPTSLCAVPTIWGRGWGVTPMGGGGDSHMKGARMLVVSLRGVNFGFWCRLGCSGQNTIIFSRKGLF